MVQSRSLAVMIRSISPEPITTFFEQRAAQQCGEETQVLEQDGG